MYMTEHHFCQEDSPKHNYYVPTQSLYAIVSVVLVSTTIMGKQVGEECTDKSGK